MAETKKFYWIKLKNDFFDIPEIDWLSDQENGYAYIVLYQKLCLLAANNNGRLSRKVGEIIIPYNVKKIAELTRFDVDTVRVALELYKNLNLIYEEEDSTLCLSGVSDMVGSESQWAEKKRLQRQNNNKLIEGQSRGQFEDNVPEMSEDNVPCAEEDNVRQEIRYKSLDIRDKSNRDKKLESRYNNSKVLDGSNSIYTNARSLNGPRSKNSVEGVIHLALNDKTEHPVTQEEIDTWKELYPAVDVIQELRNMKGWLNANPKKRKTRSGINRFINGWLAKEQDRYHPKAKTTSYSDDDEKGDLDAYF